MEESYVGPGRMVNSGPIDGVETNLEKGRKNPSVAAAIDWLENASQRGFINYPYFSEHSKIFRRLDGNPRFQELLGKIRTAWEQFQS